MPTVFDPKAFMETSRQMSAQRYKQKVADIEEKEDLKSMLGDIDTETGAPAWARLKAAFKFDREGAKESLRKSLGTDVFETENGRLAFTSPKTGRAVLVDEDGVSWADALELLPSVLPIAASIGAGIATGGASIPAQMGAAAIAGAGGEAARQAVGAALPGEENVTPAERAREVAISGALEAVGPAIGPVLRAGPGKLFRKALGGSREAAEAAEKLSARTGVPFTAGQKAGGRAQRLERWFRQQPFTADIFEGQDKMALEALADHSVRMTDKLTQKGTEEAAEAAVAAHRAVTDRVVRARAAKGAKDFAEVDRLTGGTPVFDVGPVKNRMDEFANEFAQQFSGDDAAIVRQSIARHKAELDALLERTAAAAGTEPGALTGAQMQKALSGWSKLAKDPRGVFERVLDPKLKKQYARAVLDELVQVVDNASTGVGLQADAANAIKTARQNWARASDSIRTLEANPLAEKVFGDTPEKLIETFRKDTPKNYKKLRSTMRFLNKAAPETADDVKGAVVDDFVRSVTQEVQGEEVISAAKLATKASKNRRMFETLFSGDDVSKRAFDDMVKAADKLRAVGGSQTFHMQTVTSLLGGTVGAGIGLASGGEEEGTGAGFVAGVASTIFAPRMIARAMLDPRAMRNYATVMDAAARPKLLKSPGFLMKAKNAADELVSFVGRSAVREGPSVGGRAMRDRGEELTDEQRQQEQLEALRNMAD